MADQIGYTAELSVEAEEEIFSTTSVSVRPVLRNTRSGKIHHGKSVARIIGEKIYLSDMHRLAEMIVEHLNTPEVNAWRGPKTITIDGKKARECLIAGNLNALSPD